LIQLTVGSFGYKNAWLGWSKAQVALFGIIISRSQPFVKRPFASVEMLGKVMIVRAHGLRRLANDGIISNQVSVGVVAIVVVVITAAMAC
jgi:hypothetical protein